MDDSSRGLGHRVGLRRLRSRSSWSGFRVGEPLPEPRAGPPSGERVAWSSVSSWAGLGLGPCHGRPAWSRRSAARPYARLRAMPPIRARLATGGPDAWKGPGIGGEGIVVADVHGRAVHQRRPGCAPTPGTRLRSGGRVDRSRPEVLEGLVEQGVDLFGPPTVGDRRRVTLGPAALGCVRVVLVRTSLGCAGWRHPPEFVPREPGSRLLGRSPSRQTLPPPRPAAAARRIDLLVEEAPAAVVGSSTTSRVGEVEGRDPTGIPSTSPTRQESVRSLHPWPSGGGRARSRADGARPALPTPVISDPRSPTDRQCSSSTRRASPVSISSIRVMVGRFGRTGHGIATRNKTERVSRVLRFDKPSFGTRGTASCWHRSQRVRPPWGESLVTSLLR